MIRVSTAQVKTSKRDMLTAKRKDCLQMNGACRCFKYRSHVFYKGLINDLYLYCACHGFLARYAGSKMKNTEHTNQGY